MVGHSLVVREVNLQQLLTEDHRPSTQVCLMRKQWLSDE